ncbi:MAG: sugar phosphate nucleotidyltransferase [Eubacteriales bacterium]
MNIILLSGGSGKRLWPLSNHSRSKQFLQLLTDENGIQESMVQRINRQIKSLDGVHKVIIATNQSQVDPIRNQLSKEVELVIEPERRNTFPAILLSAAYLAYEKKIDLKEPIVILPVDPYVEMEYFHLLQTMEQIIQEGQTELVLMGIQPTYPSQKYGYIQLNQPITKDRKQLCYEVCAYHEKPSEEQAMKYISQGALWNAGVFGTTLGFLMSYLEQEVQATSYEQVLESYALLERISFDRKVVERCSSISVIPYLHGWKDLGTWNTLTEEMDTTAIGAVVVDDHSCNSHIINELSIPMVVLGAKNMIVAASPDGILISEKGSSSHMKPYVDLLDNRPMFEQRRWGEYKVLDYVTYEDGMKSLTKHLQMNPEERISYQSHGMREEVWTIVDGTGILVLNDVEEVVSRGKVIQIPKGMKHALKAVTHLHFIEVQIGEDLVEEDIERYSYEWKCL